MWLILLLLFCDQIPSPQPHLYKFTTHPTDNNIETHLETSAWSILKCLTYLKKGVNRVTRVKFVIPH